MSGQWFGPPNRGGPVGLPQIPGCGGFSREVLPTVISTYPVLPSLTLATGPALDQHWISTGPALDPKTGPALDLD